MVARLENWVLLLLLALARPMDGKRVAVSGCEKVLAVEEVSDAGEERRRLSVVGVADGQSMGMERAGRPPARSGHHARK